MILKNKIVQGLILAVSLHSVRVLADIVYWHKCAGFFQSIWAFGSPTCHLVKVVSSMATPAHFFK